MVIGDGDVELDLLAQFTNNYSFLIDVLDDPEEIFFFMLFIADEILTLYCIMLKNGQTYFKNLAV